jgi:transcriptional regulator with XRE-family HTH domain
MKQFRPAKKRITVSAGESVRIIRELQGFSQNQLAQRTGIPQATLSAIENDRVRLGVERAKVLARALKCHPAVLVFPGWEDHLQTAGHNPLLQPTRSSARLSATFGQQSKH